MKRKRQFSVDLDDESSGEEEPPTKKRKTGEGAGLKSRNWFLTWNNHTTESIGDLLDIPGLIKYMIQEEKGEETGTLHLQGVMCFKHEKSWKKLREIAEIYWKPCRNVMAARNYCSKRETASGERWSKGFKVQTVVIDPLAGKTLYDWQQETLDYVNGDIDLRKIRWIWSEEGNRGKSSLIKHMCLKLGAYMFGGKMGDAKYALAEMQAKGKELPKIMVMDIPRAQGNKISYSTLEEIKNGCFFSSKYESKMVLTNIPHIIVMANKGPKEEDMSEDRWDIQRVDTAAWIAANPDWI